MTKADLDKVNEIFVGDEKNTENIFNHMDIGHNERDMYRIYSKHLLLRNHFKKIFNKYLKKDKNIKRHKIYSYPRSFYDSNILSPIRFDDENILYINAIESIGTSVELSLISS